MALTERWMRVACVIAGADFELAQQCNSIDRMIIGGNAVTLVLAGGIAVVSWSALFGTFLPPSLAIPLGGLVGGMIFMLDRAMSTSDWSLTGVLRSGAGGPASWAAVVLRVAIALVLAVATAYGTVLAVYGGAIDDHLRRQRQVQNQPVIDDALLLKQQARARLLQPLETELRLLTEERDRLQAALGEREAIVTQSRQRAAQARVEAARQREGGLRGYTRGEGPRFRDAERLERESETASLQASKDAQRIQARFDELAALTASKTKQLRDAMPLATAEERRIEGAMLTDPRWAPAHSDPLTRMLALEQMREEPRAAKVIDRAEWIAKSVLMVLELAFLLIKTLFAPASLYALRLTLRTKLDAAAEIHQYQSRLRALRQQGAGSQHRPGGTMTLDSQADPERAVDPADSPSGQELAGLGSKRPDGNADHGRARVHSRRYQRRGGRRRFPPRDVVNDINTNSQESAMGDPGNF